MKSFNLGWLFFLAILATSTLPFSQASRRKGQRVKTSVYLSPMIELGPGQVSNKIYWNVDLPRGHIALRSFEAELIDEAGNPVPTHDTYLHHWLLARIFVRKGSENHVTLKLDPRDVIVARNAGLCQDASLDFLFGSGTESRRSPTYIPDPYGIEVGNPKEIPSGFVQSWVINVHAIDIRGVDDTKRCTECWCDYYNITKDGFGKPLTPGYMGGMACCPDGSKCRTREGFSGIKRTLYLRYTVKWVDMDRSVVPVKAYVFDISDTWKRSSNSTGENAEHNCLIEYQVAPCRATGSANDECIENKRISLDMPFDGNIIFGHGHQHVGGTGISLYRKDGRRLYTSMPTYGEGEEAGNEAGYVVEMSTYYPKPGTVNISKGETLIVESNYSNFRPHYGVMGQIYILVAHQSP